MSTPASARSKIPRPIQSRTVQKRTDGNVKKMESQKKETQAVIVSKKACTEVKVQRRIDWMAKTKSDMKLQKKKICHENEPVCRRNILDEVQRNSIQQSHFNDIPFEPNKQALESILNNQGIVPGVNIRESTIQSGKRSSVYYLPPPNQSSMLKSHTEFMQNMKALQKKLRQLNFVTQSTKKQDDKLPSTPNQSRPSSVYYKIKPLNMDKSERKVPSITLSDMKILKSKNFEINGQSTVECESSTHAGSSDVLLQSTHGKENKLIMTPSAGCKKLQPLLETALPMSDLKSREHSKSSDNVNFYLNGSDIKMESEPVYASSLSQSYPHDPLRHRDSNSASVIRMGYENLSLQTGSISNTTQISHHSSSKPLIPLSLLMTPTPPRSQVSQLLYSSSFTPSTPKYSAVHSTNTLSTWTLQDLVSTPKYSHLSTNSCIERQGVLMTDNSHCHFQAIQSHHPIQNVSVPHWSSYPYHEQTPTSASVQTIATPRQTPRAPNLSSCLKTAGISSSTDQTNLHPRTSSFAKKLRWADMSNS